MLGEKNPADLLIKHSLSRVGIEMLVGVFGCQHIDGRAGAAPLLRRGDSGKQTIADADKVLGNVRGNARTIPSNLASESMKVEPCQLSTTMVSERATEGPAYRNGSEMNPGTPAVMPHILLPENELNEQHPKLHAPDEPTGSDLLDDLSDPVFQTGLKIARGIQQS